MLLVLLRSGRGKVTDKVRGKDYGVGFPCHANYRVEARLCVVAVGEGRVGLHGTGDLDGEPDGRVDLHRSGDMIRGFGHRAAARERRAAARERKAQTIGVH